MTGADAASRCSGCAVPGPALLRYSRLETSPRRTAGFPDRQTPAAIAAPSCSLEKADPKFHLTRCRLALQRTATYGGHEALPRAAHAAEGLPSRHQFEQNAADIDDA